MARTYLSRLIEQSWRDGSVPSLLNPNQPCEAWPIQSHKYRASWAKQYGLGSSTKPCVSSVATW